MAGKAEKVYDLLGIGVGPYNLGLACLSEPLEGFSTLFLDQKEEFEWHTSIMPEWSTLQVPFIADLVSFADPTSQFSFLNYIKATNQLYRFYIREDYYILRSQYNDYCKWVIEKLSNVRFNHEVSSIERDKETSLYRVSGAGFSYLTKRLVLGTGTKPIRPAFCNDVENVHLGANYLKHKQDYQTKKAITIVGGGQSGAEIYYDLLQDIDKYNYQLNWITKADRFFSMDVSKLTLEYTSPDYTEYFYSLSNEKKAALINSQSVLYKGISQKLISDIYDLLYIKSKHPGFSTRIIANSQLMQVAAKDGGLDLEFKHLLLDKTFKVDSDVLLLSLGYAYEMPTFIQSIREQINWQGEDKFALAKNYSVSDDNSIFVQNLGLYSHGISVPDLGMGCYRNSIILNSILGREVYFVENNTVFQEFSPI